MSLTILRESAYCAEHRNNLYRLWQENFQSILPGNQPSWIACSHGLPSGHEELESIRLQLEGVREWWDKYMFGFLSTNPEAGKWMQ
eukprot:scaffold292939_cov18-Tisochrysis_lutea.AAC.1